MPISAYESQSEPILPLLNIGKNKKKILVMKNKNKFLICYLSLIILIIGLKNLDIYINLFVKK